jgi:hypothetical protein
MLGWWGRLGMRNGVRNVWEISVLSEQFCCEKIKPIKNKFYEIAGSVTSLVEVTLLSNCAQGPSVGK